MKPKKWLCINILFLLILFNVYSISLYVSPNGLDSASGTSGNPLKTLSGARDWIRDNISGMTEDIRVIFSGGTYYNDKTVLFEPEDSGTNGYRIIYESGETNPNNKVLIVGGNRITGFSVYNGSIYSVHVVLEDANSRDLFENRQKGKEVLNPSNLPIAEILLQVNVAGEFYYDSGNHDLYYYPRNLPIANQQIFIPQAYDVIALEGASDNSRVENISFLNLVIMGSRVKESGFSNFNDESGLIYMENARYITIDSCELLNAGVSGIVVNKYAQNITIKNNRVDNFNLHGISLRGYMPDTGGYANPVEADVNKNNSITNNFIVNGGYRSSSGSGIRIIQSGNNSIANNRIRSISGNGIMIHGPDNEILGATYYGIIVTSGNKWNFIHARNNTVIHNDISSITPITGGGGGIYLAQHGPGTTIKNNCIHDFIINTSGAKPSGIYIGSLSENAAITSNIVYNIYSGNSLGRPMYISGNNCTIEKNVFSGYGSNSGMGFYSANNNAQDLTIRSNIFYRDRGRYIYTFEEFESIDFNNCNNNLFYHPDGAYQVKTPDNIYDFNSWQKFGGIGYDKESDTALDPLFEEPESHYYDVRSGSPALSNGFSNINQEDIGLDPAFPYQYARDVIEAEKCLSPVSLQDRITTIRSTSTGGHAEYPSIYFEDTLTNVEIKYSCDASSGTSTSRQIEIHLDSTSGTLLKTFDISGTGGITSYVIRSAGITGVSGVHDVFIVFRGSSPGIQLDWFHFYDVVAEPVLPSNLAPDVNFITPGNGEVFLIGSNIPISVSATDTDGSVANIKLFNGANKVFESSGASLSYSWPNLPLGTYTLRAEAMDNDGGVGEALVTFSVSDVPNDPPTVQISLSPPEGGRYHTGDEVIITVTAEDDDGIRDVVLYINGQWQIRLDSQPYVFTWTIVQPGDYTIKAVATDKKVRLTEISVDLSAFCGPEYIIGHWPLDSVSGGIVEDISGHENHGVATNVTTTYGVKDGSACYFDGTSFIDTGKSLMNGLPQFTFAGWIKAETGAAGSKIGFWGQRGMISFGFSTETTLQVFTDQKGGIAAQFNKDRLNEWHHLTVLGDGKGLQLYLDGISYVPKTVDPVSNYGTSGSPFLIGGGGIFDTSGNFFVGAIDDVWLFKWAISEAEIRALASRGANLRPYVNITTPADGASYDAPADITIRVDARDTDGYISVIELSTQEGVIGSIYEEPYEFLWTGVPPGNYTVSAKAFDNENVSSTDSIVVTVFEQTDILASWSLNEGSGLIAYEDSGNNDYNGEIFFADWDEGLYGSCLYFDGHGIVKTAPGLINGLPEFTVSYWMKPTKINTMMGILGQNEAFINSFNHEKLLAIWTAGGLHTSVPTEIPLDQWSHIALVGTGASLLIYINGEVTGRVEHSTNNYGFSQMRFEFGGITGYSAEGQYYQGYLDEITVYKRALQEDEIKVLAIPPDPTSPSMRIVSPIDLSKYDIGESVTIQAEVINVGLSGVFLEVYVDNEIETTLEDSFATELAFDEPGEYLITLKAQSDNGLWAEDSVSITILTAEESEALQDEETDLSDETNPDEWDEDDETYPEDENYEKESEKESADANSAKFMHASREEIINSLQKKEVYKDETFVEYIERLAREKEIREKNEEKMLSESKTDETLLVHGNGENGKIEESGNNPAKKDNGKETETASGNIITWLFGNSETEQGAKNNKPSFVYFLIVILSLIVFFIACVIIIKKIYGRKKPKYYYD